MNRSDYLIEAVIEGLKNVRERGSYKEDNDSYKEDAWRASLADNNLNEEEGNRWDEHRNGYLAACLANSAERSAEGFRDNPNLKERTADIYLGKHDRAKAVFSREYENDEDEIIHNHVLVEHTRDNNHLEGVQRMASAYFSFTNSEQDE